MGCGKSTIGKLLASRLGYRFLDTDALVVEMAGMQISEIFARVGEPAFRHYERQVLERLIARKAQRLVLATGGGIVTQPENISLLHELGWVVQLTAREEVIFERVSRNKSRPLLATSNPRETLHKLLETREPLYAAAAQFTLDTSDRPHSKVADAILEEARRALP